MTVSMEKEGETVFMAYREQTIWMEDLALIPAM